MKFASLKSITFATAHALTRECLTKTFEFVGEYRQLFPIYLKRTHAALKNPVTLLQVQLAAQVGAVTGKTVTVESLGITLKKGSEWTQIINWFWENGYNVPSFMHCFSLERIAKGKEVASFTAEAFEVLKSSDLTVSYKTVEGYTCYAFSTKRA